MTYWEICVSSRVKVAYWEICVSSRVKVAYWGRYVSVAELKWHIGVDICQ